MLRNSVDLSYLRRDSLGVDNFLEHVDHVKELTMDITDDDDRLLDSQHVRFAPFTSIRRYTVSCTSIELR